MSALRFIATATILLASAAESFAQGCAMCGSSFGQNDPVQNAFSWSVLFLMVVPYSIAAVIGIYFVRADRRPRSDRGVVLRLVSVIRRPKGDLA